MPFAWNRTAFGLVYLQDTTQSGIGTAQSKLDADVGPSATNQVSTTIAAGSNNASLPQATINVVATTNMQPSGIAWVTTADGNMAVTYTGITATTLTGCSGGSGAMSTGGAVVAQGTAAAQEATYQTDRTSLTGADANLKSVVSGAQVALSAANPGV